MPRSSKGRRCSSYVPVVVELTVLAPGGLNHERNHRSHTEAMQGYCDSSKLKIQWVPQAVTDFYALINLGIHNSSANNWKVKFSRPKGYNTKQDTSYAEDIGSLIV